MADIRHLLTISASAASVYRAITEQEGLRAWWTTESFAKPEIGAVAEFRFGDRYRNKMRILRLDPVALVKWECLEGDQEWIGTRFIFDLTDNDHLTVLRFCHCDWREATDFYASCNYQWAYYMNSLKSYCETGRGMPYGTADA
jgi:uncharacterized protein YndB with AHSA1/START domain